MFDLASIQKSLREFGIDAWLLYDFRGSNLLGAGFWILKVDHRARVVFFT